MGLAAVPWDRRQTYEAGGLGVLETPELGRLDDKHVCGHLADAWNARQDVEPLAQVRVCVAQCFEASRSIASIWPSIWRNLWAN